MINAYTSSINNGRAFLFENVDKCRPLYGAILLANVSSFRKKMPISLKRDSFVYTNVIYRHTNSGPKKILRTLGRLFRLF